MASAVINWTPGNTLASQQVQYRVTNTSNWVTAADLSKTANTYTITNLQCGVYYQIRVVGICANSGNQVISNIMTSHC